MRMLRAAAQQTESESLLSEVVKTTIGCFVFLNLYFQCLTLKQLYDKL